ncbi:uncharacterized protein EV422DRAFT_536119 [Fimicolochytrium jonesii]|uniref:uncharacterized protein n=1 Tax=Fimicolochytrium jonesii TaxID=1396493 RepID=UPI0022FE9C00|nr:uncharacterized protein EV422DRAFT_536119 [Fimicolochytrium jonesii]KAI8818969.1 hypothetical protein EV422DRAFT_536119 [Fimicolochytrium jonesii]
MLTLGSGPVFHLGDFPSSSGVSSPVSRALPKPERKKYEAKSDTRTQKLNQMLCTDLEAMPVERPLRIAFYISGHGFGHATRATVTIRYLLELGHYVTIVSSAPSFIFLGLLEEYLSCTLRSIATLDPGVVQRDPVTVDVDETMRQLELFLESAETVKEQEAVWMENERLDVVCLDAPFLPAVVAKQVGIPSVMITNFTFDAIFSAIGTTDHHKRLVQQCAEMYADADYLLRMPGHIPIPSFQDRPSQTIELPLIVRKARMPPAQVRRTLDIPPSAPCVLITFGGFEIGGDALTAVQVLPDGWYGLVACPFAGVDASGRLRRIRTEKWYMPDLLNAADVVLGKCGYGTCSEVVAHNVPLVYVPRSGFAEEEGLVENLMKPYGCSVEMPQSDFYKGNWAEYILRAAELQDSESIRHRIEDDGEALASELVVSIARNGLVV